MIGAIGAALTPVMFAYGGWQTSSFVAGEMRDPRRDLARGVLMGVIGVVVLYAAVAFTCVYVLGPAALAETRTPASAVMRLALGETGATLIALGIAISALGFMSQGMLTTPRVYFAMAEDRLFFSGSRQGEREDPCAGRRHPAPGRGGDRDRSDRQLRADLVLRRLGRFHLVRVDRRGPVRLPPARRQGARPGSRRPAIRSPPACSSSPAR